MSLLRRGSLLVAAGLFAVACGGASTPSSAPATTSTNPTPAPTTATETTAPATDQPTAEATAEPTAEATPEATTGSDVLDPSQSDAGVVGRATISGDSRTDVIRDGTWDIVGVAEDGFGSGCSTSFDGEEFIATAYDDDAPEGEVMRLGVTVAASDIPEGDEVVSGIEDGGVNIDFQSEEFFGSSYSADTEDDDRTSVTIGVTRSGDQLTFDFNGLTWDGVEITGLVVCDTAS